jgi:hypothetical protein
MQRLQWQRVLELFKCIYRMCAHQLPERKVSNLRPNEERTAYDSKIMMPNRRQHKLKVDQICA